MPEQVRLVPYESGITIQKEYLIIKIAVVHSLRMELSGYCILLGIPGHDGYVVTRKVLSV